MGTRTILVAENSEDDVLLIKRAFARGNSRSRICFVANGEQALAYLKGDGEFSDRRMHPYPDLLLLDLCMPRMNGLEVLDSIRRNADLRRLPVVMFSGSAQPKDIQIAMDLCANSYVVKPSNPALLVPMLQRIESYWFSVNRSSPETRAPDV